MNERGITKPPLFLIKVACLPNLHVVINSNVMSSLNKSLNVAKVVLCYT